jgi:hypothetical protein
MEGGWGQHQEGMVSFHLTTGLGVVLDSDQHTIGHHLVFHGLVVVEVGLPSERVPHWSDWTVGRQPACPGERWGPSPAPAAIPASLGRPWWYRPTADCRPIPVGRSARSPAP